MKPNFFWERIVPSAIVLILGFGILATYQASRESARAVSQNRVPPAAENR